MRFSVREISLVPCSIGASPSASVSKSAHMLRIADWLRSLDLSKVSGTVGCEVRDP